MKRKRIMESLVEAILAQGENNESIRVHAGGHKEWGTVLVVEVPYTVPDEETMEKYTSMLQQVITRYLDEFCKMGEANTDKTLN